MPTDKAKMGNPAPELSTSLSDTRTNLVSYYSSLTTQTTVTPQPSDHLVAPATLARSASISPSVQCLSTARSIDREGARVAAEAGGGILPTGCTGSGDSSPDIRRLALKLARPRKLGIPVALVACVLSCDAADDEADEAEGASPNIFLVLPLPSRSVSDMSDAADGFDSWASYPLRVIACMCDALLR